MVHNEISKLGVPTIVDPVYGATKNKPAFPNILWIEYLKVIQNRSTGMVIPQLASETESPLNISSIFIPAFHRADSAVASGEVEIIADANVLAQVVIAADGVVISIAKSNCALIILVATFLAEAEIVSKSELAAP